MKPELEEVLLHFGVKGMKWGKRKKRPESKEVQKAKADVTKRTSEYKVAAKQYQLESMYRIPTQKTIDRFQSTNRELRYAKEDLAKAKILDKIKDKPKTDYFKKMEDKYKKQGMSNDDAAVAAYKNIRFKKIAAVAAITTLAVAGTYAGVKIRAHHFDKVIKAGTSLQNVTSDSNKGIRDAFYAAKNGLDKTKYKGIYGGHLKAQKGAAFAKEVKVLKDIKQASPKNAHRVLDDLFKKDKEFAQGMADYIKKEANGLGDVYSKKALKGGMALKKGKVDKHAYEVFNAALVDHSPQMQKLTDRYFKALSEKGYNAIKDVNDAKYSGYKALNPIITFGTKGKVNVVNVKELTQKEIGKNAKVAYAHIIGSDLVKSGATTAAAWTGASSAIKFANKKVSNKRITKYREENPNTKLSNTEIIRMLERGA